MSAGTHGPPVGGTPSGHGAAPATGRGPDALRGHELDRTPSRPFVVGGTVFVVLLALAYVVPTALESLLVADVERSGPAPNPLVQSAGRQLPPEPRLQVNPARDIAELRAAEQAILDGYGWVDRDAGIVRIPIARAIEILARQPGMAAGGGAERAAAPASGGGPAGRGK